jgi:hypothetical protein
MIHAYSPAKPSPLSRILMLANSPDIDFPANSSAHTASPCSMPTLPEENENEEGHEEWDESKKRAPIPALFSGASAEVMQAAVESGSGTESDQESGSAGLNLNPLREKTTGRNQDGGGGVLTAKGRVLHPAEPKRFTALEKAKGKAEMGAAVPVRARAMLGEKENDGKVLVGTGRTGGKAMGGKAAGVGNAKVLVGTSKVKVPLGPGKGGARRVPVGSAEAPVLSGKGVGWRG